MSKKLILLGCMVIYSISASAQSNETEKEVLESETISLNNVVVVGTRFEVPIEKSGKTIYKLTAEDIEKNAGKTVADLLNEVPGVQMEGNFGSPGTNISMYVRGGRNKNTLILIDGVPLNDPSGINASYDLRLLPVSQIESIEILKGGLSTLYGTGASSAVINIILKQNKSEGIDGNLDINYGSYATLRTSASLLGKTDKLSYMFSASLANSDGFSSASDEQSTTAFVKDGFNQKNGMLKLGYTVNDHLSIEGVVAYDDFEADYDGGAFFDQDNVQTGKMFRIGIAPKYKYDKGEVNLKMIRATNEREFISSFPSAYEGANLQLDLSQRHMLNSKLTGLWGVGVQSFSYEQENGIGFDDTKFSLIDPYGSLFYENESGLNIHIGARLNTHSEYGSKFVYNLNPSYLFELSDEFRMKLLASASTTYITPTGYQLFSDFGNKDLTPEESLNLEFGGAFYFNKSMTLNLTYFERNEENAIDFVSQFDDMGNWIGGAYDNLSAERKVNGYEVDLTYIINDQISFSGNYSHAETDDETTFYRIPKDKFGFSTSISPHQNTALTVKYNHTGARTIFDFGGFTEVELESYGLIDLYAQQELLDKKLTVYGSINNVADTDFVSVFGFTTRGRNYNIGLKYNF